MSAQYGIDMAPDMVILDGEGVVVKAGYAGDDNQDMSETPI